MQREKRRVNGIDYELEVQTTFQEDDDFCITYVVEENGETVFNGYVILDDEQLNGKTIPEYLKETLPEDLKKPLVRDVHQIIQDLIQIALDSENMCQYYNDIKEWGEYNWTWEDVMELVETDYQYLDKLVTWDEEGMLFGNFLNEFNLLDPK